MNTDGSFGDWLRQRRKALDLTQADLADQVGCAVTTIKKIEAGTRRPSKQIAGRLADVLAISPEERAGFLIVARHLSDELPAPLPNLASSAPVHLPVQPTPFIGRERELAQIAERLADPTCRLLTLVGPGGIGKTRLAVQAAAARFDDFADGACFVALAPVGSTTLIAAAIAAALQVSFYTQDDPDAQLVKALRGKQLLLVLDNYEHLIGGVGLIVALLAGAPRLKLLLTSRERLSLRDEWVLPVDGLPFPTRDATGTLEDFAAVELFVRTAQRVQPDFALEANQIAVVDVCRAVEGMPLGIELAATWLRAMPCAQIALEIQRDLDFLATPLRDVPERHRSLRALFEHSWALLSEVEREVVMRLSVFRGGADAEAAESVAGASRLLLAGLVDKSFVRVNPVGRYEMHELLRQFAAGKLDQARQTTETQRRHLDYFMNMTERIEPLYFGPRYPLWLACLETELDNCRAALDWAAVSGDAESGLRLAGALGWFWNRRAHWKEGGNRLESFLAAGSRASLAARAKALHHAIELRDQLNDTDHAASLAAQAIPLAHELSEPRPRAWLLTSVGFIGYPDIPHAEASLEEALGLFMQIGDQWGICEALSRLGQKLYQRGEFARAATFQEEGIRLARQAGDKSVLSWLLLLSTGNQSFQGHIDERAEPSYQQSLALFTELRDKSGMIAAFFELGCVHGDATQAGNYFQECLQLAQQVGDVWYIVRCLIRPARLRCDDVGPQRSARIIGAVSDRVQVYFSLPRMSQREARTDYERALAAVHARLDDARFAAAFAEGQRMTLDEAIADVLESATVDTPSA